jgi:hypothetical protein
MVRRLRSMDGMGRTAGLAIGAVARVPLNSAWSSAASAVNFNCLARGASGGTSNDVLSSCFVIGALDDVAGTRWLDPKPKISPTSQVEKGAVAGENTNRASQMAEVLASLVLINSGRMVKADFPRCARAAGVDRWPFKIGATEALRHGRALRASRLATVPGGRR